MTFKAASLFSALLAALLPGLTGCDPSSGSRMDDEKEPHYLQGKNCVNAMDYTGAEEAFSEALAVNPRSGPAHFQLACLFDTKLDDPVSAIYHYQQYLKINPKADNAEVVNQRVESCKQKLASDVMPLPSTSAAQRQLEDLLEKNRRLQAEVETWRTQYAALQNAIRQPAGGSRAIQPNALTGNPAGYSASLPVQGADSGAQTRQPPPNPGSRTHVVAAGETLAGIARKYGTTLAALQTANPGVKATKLKVGQTLNIPAR